MSAAREPANGLVFYPRAHRYKLDGKWIPGVTTLIKQGLPNETLKYWSAKCVAEYVADNAEGVHHLRKMGRWPMINALKEIPWQKRDDAAVRGTDVHALAERVAQGEEVEVPQHLEGYVEQCIRFLDDWQPKPLIVERPVAHRGDWWAGTPDMFAALPDGRTALFDWKTAASGIWPETAYQLSAYSHGEFFCAEDGTEQPVPAVDFCAAVWLQEDQYQVIPVKADDDVYAEFLHVSAVAASAKQAKGNKTTVGYVGLPLETPERVGS